MNTIVQAHIDGVIDRVRAIDDGDAVRELRLIAQGKLRLCQMTQLDLTELAQAFTPKGGDAFEVMRSFIRARSEALETMPEWIGDIGGR